jgi:hypothetical protein
MTQEETREMFVRACLARHEAHRRSIAAQANLQQKYALSTQQMLVTAWARHQKCRKEVAALSGIDLEKFLAKEFDDISAMPQFVAMRIGHEVIQVFVSSHAMKANMRSVHGSKSGLFCIELGTNGEGRWGIGTVAENGSISMSDRYCLGNIADDVVCNTRAFQFAIVVRWLIEYMERG